MLAPISGVMDGWTLWVLVLLMGLRHGFDLDHLATIDQLTRYFSLEGRPWSRYCGVLFSMGHGIVVLLIAANVHYWMTSSSIPADLETFGTLISVFFLVALAGLNLWSLINTAPTEPVQLMGLKNRWLGMRSDRLKAGSVLVVGALFALSFDTVSQAALFAGLGSRFGGVMSACGLGLTFVAGMLLVDGLNGVWVFKLMSGTDTRSIRLTRRIVFCLSFGSLLLALYALTMMFYPRFIS
jgi:high-affinity nickel-transport protein